MARGLDHVAHAVRDLDAAADLYRRMGFTVGARNRHSWGTHNCIVQLPGFFVEVLTVGEPEKLGADGLSEHFGRFHQQFLTQREGLSFLVLESRDAKADARAFEVAGIAASAPLPFEREAKRPDGSGVKVGFTLAFARNELAPQSAFAVCQQHYPENFWNPKFQVHANTTSAIAGVVMIAESPADQQIFLSAFVGERELQSSSAGLTITTPRGDIQAMEPRAFRDHYGLDAVAETGARLAALRFSVRELDAVEAALRQGAISFAKHMGRLVVPPDQAMGAAIAFEKA